MHSHAPHHLLRRILRGHRVAAVTALAALAAPAAALAAVPHGSGGVGISGSPTATSTTPVTSTTVSVVNVNAPVSVNGDGLTLQTTESGERTHKLIITGTTPSAIGTDEAVAIERRASAGGAWKKIGFATTEPQNAFTFTWKVDASGRISLRAVIVTVGTSASSAAAGIAATPALPVTIFKPARATLYGPHMWGRKTACGEKLEKTTIGVASRTLKCGTLVDIYYNGHELIAPVIDRGPYANNAKWDLTLATAEALNIGQTVTIGTLG